MTIQEAAALIRLLLTGTDSETGETLPPDHLLNTNRVREALLVALQALGAQQTGGSLPVTRSGRLNAGRPWSREDLSDLRLLHESGLSIDAIAQLIHRRRRGVRTQLNLMAGRGNAMADPAPMDAADDNGPAVRPDAPIDRRGQHWTQEDDALLAERFRQGQSIRQLAVDFGRSAKGIEKRLEKLMLLPDEDAPHSPDRRWTQEEVALLRSMHAAGLPAGHIAARMNRTEEAISARLFYLGLGGRAPALFPPDTPVPPPRSPEAPPPPPESVIAARSSSRRWTKEEDDYLRQAWAEGVLLDEIVRHTGRRDHPVRCRLIFLGLADQSLLGRPPVPPELAHQGLPWYPEEIDLLLYMFRQGASAEAMAAKLLRSVDLVRSRLEILGLENAP